MILQIVKHSYQEAFMSTKENAACTVDGAYTKVYFDGDKTTVTMNRTTEFGRVGTRKITGKKAEKIANFVRTNLNGAK